jgi:hypothetical protein
MYILSLCHQSNFSIVVTSTIIKGVHKIIEDTFYKKLLHFLKEFFFGYFVSKKLTIFNFIIIFECCIVEPS